MATSTIKPSGGDYTTLTAWEAAKQGTLTEMQIAECYSFGTGGLDDKLTIDGSTTTSSAYMMVTVAAGERHSGVWDSSKFYLIPSAVGNVVVLSDNYATVEWLQIIPNTGGTGAGASLNNLGNKIRNCIIDGQESTSIYGIYSAAGSELFIYNNILYGTKRSFFGGIRINHTGSCSVLNNTVYNNYAGVNAGGTACVVKNNACFNNTNNFLGTADTTNSGYNATNSASGAPGSNNIYSLTAANEFVSLTDGSEDFHLLSTSNLIGFGADLSGVFTDDIDGQTRSSWDIGADEYVASGGQTGSLTDTFSFSGSHTPLAHYSSGLTDSIGLGEGKTSLGNYLASLADSMALDGAYLPLAGYLAALSDSVGLADTRTPLLGFWSALSDSVTLDEALTALAKYRGSLVDSLTMADTVAGIAALIASLSDQVALTGQESAATLSGGELADTITLSDSTQAIAALFASLDESITLSDAVIGLLAAKASLSDILTVADNRSAIGNLIAGLIDNLAFVDLVAGVAGWSGQSAAISDAILLSDSRTATGLIWSALTTVCPWLMRKQP